MSLELENRFHNADEKHKIKIARREAKESLNWIGLILIYDNPVLAKEKEILVDEGQQILRILSAIIKKLGG